MKYLQIIPRTPTMPETTPSGSTSTLSSGEIIKYSNGGSSYGVKETVVKSVKIGLHVCMVAPLLL